MVFGEAWWHRLLVVLVREPRAALRVDLLVKSSRVALAVGLGRCCRELGVCCVA